MHPKVLITTVLVASAACLVPVAAFAQTGGQEDLSATGTEQPAARAHAAALSAEDSEFLAKAVKVSAREVADADLVLHTSQRPAVKSAARDIASTHTKAREQIDALARRKGMSLSDETMSAPYDTSRSDSAMVAALLKTHEDAVASFHRESIRGSDPEVKRFAEGALPSLQRDLASLRSLQTALPGDEST